MRPFTLFFALMLAPLAHATPLVDLSKDYVASENVQGLLIIQQDTELLFSHSGQCGVDASSQFLIGSISKQFVAAALLEVLSDEVFDRSVLSFLPPEDPIWGGSVPEWAGEVTLAQLLNHTSGLANYTCVPEFEACVEGHPFYYWPHTSRELIALVKDRPLECIPGSREIYSNTNYLLAAEILERATGRPYAHVIQEKLLRPAGMDKTAILPPRGRLPDLYKLYPQLVRLPQPPCEYMDVSMAKGAGFLVSTASDLFKWMLFVRSKPYYTTLVEKGYGIMHQKTKAGPAVGHAGTLEDYYALLLDFTEQMETLVLLTTDASNYYTWIATIQETP